jgi:hypothetical protein
MLTVDAAEGVDTIDLFDYSAAAAGARAERGTAFAEAQKQTWTQRIGGAGSQMEANEEE